MTKPRSLWEGTTEGHEFQEACPLQAPNVTISSSQSQSGCEEPSKSCEAVSPVDLGIRVHLLLLPYPGMTFNCEILLLYLVWQGIIRWDLRPFLVLSTGFKSYLNTPPYQLEGWHPLTRSLFHFSEWKLFQQRCCTLKEHHKFPPLFLISYLLSVRELWPCSSKR